MAALPTIAICAVKDEGSYMLEWIAYHRSIGFDEVLIVTNDNTDGSLELYRALAKAVDWVHVLPHEVTGPRVVPQRQGYRKARKWLRERQYRGLAAVLDADEFLILHDDPDVRSLWARFPGADVLSMNWLVYGSSGHVERPPGLVLEAFTKCAPEDFADHHQIKSLFVVDPGLVQFKPHFPRYAPDPPRRWLQMDGAEMDGNVGAGPRYGRYTRVCFAHAQINHYLVKSRAEYEAKRRRGQGDVSRADARTSERHSAEFFVHMDRNERDAPVPEAVLARTRAGIADLCAAADLPERWNPVAD